MSEAPLDPIRAARAHMRQAPIKRFYRAVEVREVEGGRHAVTLDGRGARTPGRNALSATSRALMTRVAAEWERQRETIDPADMPLTRLLNSAIDGVARTMAETRADVLKYAGSDLLCYRAEEPEAPAERQRLAFDPILAWAREAHGARFVLAQGVVFVTQPEAAVAAMRRLIPVGAWRLGAVHVITTLTGSALIALALAGQAITADNAWAAAHVDENWNEELWGRDDGAVARRALRRTEFDAAISVLRLVPEAES